MKNFLLALTIVLVPVVSYATTMSTTIAIGKPITISEVTPASVGNFTYQTTDGIIAAFPDGYIARGQDFSGGTSDAVIDSPKTPVYGVTGSPQSQVTVTIGDVDPLLDSNSDNMYVTIAFIPAGSHDTTQGTSTTTVTLNSNGAANVNNLYVGAYITSDLPQGTYTGTYEVTGSY